MSNELTTRCTNCSAEFTDAELMGASCCPKCGSTGIPCDIKDDVTIRVNWHELRILGLWADNWASTPNFPESGRRVVAAILARLEKQYPDKTPLTLAGEVRQLQTKYPTYPTMELIRDGETIVPPKKTQ